MLLTVSSMSLSLKVSLAPGDLQRLMGSMNQATPCHSVEPRNSGSTVTRRSLGVILTCLSRRDVISDLNGVVFFLRKEVSRLRLVPTRYVNNWYDSIVIWMWFVLAYRWTGRWVLPTVRCST